MVYSRELDENTTLTLAPSGWTWGEVAEDSTFVLYDKETLSLWFPMQDGDCCKLVCVSGEYADLEITGLMRMTETTWSQWVADNPDTKYVTE